MTSKFVKKSTSSDLNEIWYDIKGRWDIHYDMTFKVIQGQGQGHVRLKVPKMTIFKFYLLRHFSTNQKNSNGFWYYRPPILSYL